MEGIYTPLSSPGERRRNTIFYNSTLAVMYSGSSMILSLLYVRRPS